MSFQLHSNSFHSAVRDLETKGLSSGYLRGNFDKAPKKEDSRKGRRMKSSAKNDFNSYIFYYVNTNG